MDICKFSVLIARFPSFTFHQFGSYDPHIFDLNSSLQCARTIERPESSNFSFPYVCEISSSFSKHLFFPPSPDMVNATIKDDQDASNRRRNHFRKLKMCFHRARMELMMSTRFNLFLLCALCWGERTPSAGHFHPIESCRE